MDPPLFEGFCCIISIMSPRNYHAKFTPGSSNASLWWRFASSQQPIKNEEKKKKKIRIKLFSKLKNKNYNKDFK